MIRIMFISLMGLNFLHGDYNTQCIVDVTDKYALGFGPYKDNVLDLIESARISYVLSNSKDLPPVESSKIILVTTCFADNIGLPTPPTDSILNRTSGKPTLMDQNDQITWYHFRVHPYLFSVEKFKFSPYSQEAQAEFQLTHLDFDDFIDELIIMLETCNEGFTYIYIHCLHGHSRSFATTGGLLMKRYGIPLSILMKDFQTLSGQCMPNTRTYLQAYECYLNSIRESSPSTHLPD